MLPKSKLNSIKNLISQALTDLEIWHKEFKTFFNEKKKVWKKKEDIKMMKGSD